jgi:hypothetical protein
MPEISCVDLTLVHDLIDDEHPETRIEAANLALDRWKPREHISNVSDANRVLLSVYHSLIERGAYGPASLLCWGRIGFNPEPYFVRKVWGCLRRYDKLLIMGAASCGKSFNCYAHDLHDWARDPWYTTIKIISTTAGHAKAQAMSTFVRLHRDSVIPMPGYIRQGFIGMDKDDMRSSISELAIDKGSEVQGKSSKLHGFHPYPRRRPHPVFGNLSRVRARLEECEDIPSPVWPAVTNLMATAGGKNVTVCGMWNPKNPDSAVHKRAEPIKGWNTFDVERSEEWDSKLGGFHVLRLDGKKCENVIERRIVYEGLIDYEGYHQYDESSADFWTFSRGCYPPETATFGIINLKILNQRRGRFIWERYPTPFGTLDMAEEGPDRAIYTAGEYGKAIAFQPEVGPRQRFESPRWCIQVDQQFPIPKQNTILMGAEVIKMSRMLSVTPDWFALDCTNSVTLRDWLKLRWGNVLGIKWGEAATDVPILEQEQEKPSELYDNIKTEMWFATGAWAEFGYIAFSPHMDTTDLFSQLSGMHYRRISKVKKRCEDTREFKKRFAGQSPDEAASCVMGVHLIRMRSDYTRKPAMDPIAAAQSAELMREPALASVTSSDTSECIDSIDFI